MREGQVQPTPHLPRKVEGSAGKFRFRHAFARLEGPSGGEGGAPMTARCGPGERGSPWESATWRVLDRRGVEQPVRPLNARLAQTAFYCLKLGIFAVLVLECEHCRIITYTGICLADCVLFFRATRASGPTNA